MKPIYVLFAILAIIILAACDASSKTAEDEIVPSLPTVEKQPDNSPPPATLTINGTTQTAGVGTYCWSSNTSTGETVHTCMDKVGIPTARDPLNSSSPVAAVLTLSLNDPPTQIVLSVFQVSDINELPESEDGNRWWNFIEGFTSKLSLQTSQEIKQELQPGLYVFYVFAVWEGRGDVSYGFLVEVK